MIKRSCRMETDLLVVRWCYETLTLLEFVASASHYGDTMRHTTWHLHKILIFLMVGHTGTHIGTAIGWFLWTSKASFKHSSPQGEPLLFVRNQDSIFPFCKYRSLENLWSWSQNSFWHTLGVGLKFCTTNKFYQFWNQLPSYTWNIFAIFHLPSQIGKNKVLLSLCAINLQENCICNM